MGVFLELVCPKQEVRAQTLAIGLSPIQGIYTCRIRLINVLLTEHIQVRVQIVFVHLLLVYFGRNERGNVEILKW